MVRRCADRYCKITEGEFNSPYLAASLCKHFCNPLFALRSEHQIARLQAVDPLLATRRCNHRVAREAMVIGIDWHIEPFALLVLAVGVVLELLDEVFGVLGDADLVFLHLREACINRASELVNGMDVQAGVVDLVHQARIRALGDDFRLPADLLELTDDVAGQHVGLVAQLLEVHPALKERNLDDRREVVAVAEVDADVAPALGLSRDVVDDLELREHQALDDRTLAQAVDLPQGLVFPLQRLDLVDDLLLQERVVLVGADEVVGLLLLVDLVDPVLLAE